MGLLQDKYAIVTGAASARGLGKATAAMFAEHGATVAILDLDDTAAEAAAADLGEGHVGLACNVTDKTACTAAVQTLRGPLGPHRRPGEQRRHHPAAQDHGDRAAEL